MDWGPYSQKARASRLYHQGDKIVNQVIIQGSLVILKSKVLNTTKQKPHIRGDIRGFSASSRRNLLKKIAVIDWKRIKQGVFVTLTYPDAKAMVDVADATMHRHTWIRYAEKHVSGEIPIIWGKEQKRRKSGRYRGMLVQHFHLCVLGVKFIDYHLVRQWWRQTIHAEGPLSTHVKAMESGQHSAFYLAKYMAEQKEDYYLEDVSYLSKPGRHWGIHREGLVPYCPADSWVGLTDAEYLAIVKECKRFSARAREFALESFTLLGKQAVKAKKAIYEILS